jgi:formylglycine-generating enzyme required for sulfatase activity
VAHELLGTAVMTSQAWDKVTQRPIALPVFACWCILLTSACVESASDEPPADDGTGSGGEASGDGDDDNASGSDSGGSSSGDGDLGSEPQVDGATDTPLEFTCESEAAPGDMVEVAAGEFMMGCDETVDEACEDDELPQHILVLSAFQIDRTEVTQDQYTACVVAGACEPPSCAWDCAKTNDPATCVTWAQAKSYCNWAEKRLPSEAEWEKAARGDQGATYPWGDAEPDCTLANMEGCGAAVLPVGSLSAGASPWGALDMAGNVVEMVADWYDETYYLDSPATDPTGPETGNRYGGRGGGYASEAIWLRAAKRDWYDLSDWAVSLGFRCAR